MQALAQTRERFVTHPGAMRATTLALVGGMFGWFLTILLNRFDPVLVLLGMTLVGGGVLLLLWPDLAMPLGVAVLYANLQVIGGTSTVVTAAIAAAWIGLLLFPLVHALIMRRTRPRIDGVLVLMLAFLMTQLISSMVARDLWIALGQIGQYLVEGLALYFVVVNLLRSSRTLHAAIWAVVLTCALLASMTAYQAITRSYQQQFGGLAGRQLRYEQEELAQIKASGGRKVTFRLADRAAGPVGDPNRYAQMLLVAAPFAVYLTTRARSQRARLVAGGSAVLILSGIVLTYSRGAFLTMSLVLALLVLWKTIRVSHLITATTVLALAVLLFAPSYVARIATIGSSTELGDTGGGQPDAAIRGRATEMLASLSVFLDHPILGVGPGQYKPFYSEQYQLSPDIAFRFLPREREPHNLLLGLAAENGILGLAVFVTIILVLLVGLWRIRKYWLWRDVERTGLAAAAFLGVVAYVGTGFFLHLAFERYFWFLVGLANACRHLLIRDAWIVERARRAA